MTDVEVPGQGTLSFPDEMSEDDIRGVIQRKFPDLAKQREPPKSAFQRGAELVEEGMGGIPLKSQEDVQAVGTAYGELAKGVPIAGAYVPQSKGMTQFEQQHPVESKIMQGIGGTMATLPLVAAAPAAFGLSKTAPLWANMGTGATTGAALNTADALARGEDWKAPAAIGAAIGGGVPAIGAGISAGWNTLRGQVAPAARDMFDQLPKEGIDMLVKAAKADGLTDAQIAQKINEQGPQAFLGEYGPNLRGLTSNIAGNPGTGRATIDTGFRARAEGARDRIEQGITDTLGPRVNVNDLTREGFAQRSANAAPLFDQFRTTTVHPTQEIKDMIAGTDNTAGFEQLGLLNHARDMSRLESAATGQPAPPMQNFFTTGDRKSWPTTQSFQYVKQALDARIEAGTLPNGRLSQEGRFYLQMKNRLDRAIANSNQDAATIWQQARHAWAEPTQINAARDAGRGFMQMHPDDMSTLLSGYGTPEYEAFKEGARDSLGMSMDRAFNGDTTTRNALLAPANVNRLRMLSNNPAMTADDLSRAMGWERQYAGNQSRIIDNSETYARQAMEKLTEPQGSWIGDLREKYAPHVQPFSWLPWLKRLEEWSKQNRAARYEAGRNAAAPFLMRQGPQAQEAARALVSRVNAMPQYAAPDQTQMIIRALGQQLGTPTGKKNQPAGNYQ